MKRANFLATAALLAMLILAPMAWAQGGNTSNPCAQLAYDESHNRPLSREERHMRASGFCNQGADVVYTSSASASSTPVPLGGTGGPAILLPVASLLLGSGILTYAILRRR